MQINIDRFGDGRRAMKHERGDGQPRERNLKHDVPRTAAEVAPPVAMSGSRFESDEARSWHVQDLSRIGAEMLPLGTVEGVLDRLADSSRGHHRDRRRGDGRTVRAMTCALRSVVARGAVSASIALAFRLAGLAAHQVDDPGCLQQRDDQQQSARNAHPSLLARAVHCIPGEVVIARDVGVVDQHVELEKLLRTRVAKASSAVGSATSTTMPCIPGSRRAAVLAEGTRVPRLRRQRARGLILLREETIHRVEQAVDVRVLGHGDAADLHVVVLLRVLDLGR